MSSIAEIKIENITTWIRIRGISERGISRIKTSIQEKGFLERYPIAVSPLPDGKYLCLDGAHRIEALMRLGTETVLAQVFEDLTEDDQRRIAWQSNKGLEVIEPQDWTDDAAFIWHETDSGKTQERIAAIVGWTREKVRDYIALAKIDPEAWKIIVGATKQELAPEEEAAVAPAFGATAPKIFTEGLLRPIVAITAIQQLELVGSLAKGKIDKGKFKTRAEQYRGRNDLAAIAERQLSAIEGDYLERALKEIERGSYDKEWQMTKSPAENFWKLINSLKDEHDKKRNYRLLHGDMNIVGIELEAESIDCIITDPPYKKEAIPLYENLAVLAAHVLKPGGSLLVMCGQSYIPDILALMTPHIRYHWMAAYLTPGGQAVQLWTRNVNTFWKPILWFVKGEYSDKWVGDVYAGKGGDVAKSAVNDNDKRHHEWGQSESGMKDLIERFSLRGEIILDPFMGAGTTGVAAIALGRGFIGIDNDENNVRIAERRMGEILRDA